MVQLQAWPNVEQLFWFGRESVLVLVRGTFTIVRKNTSSVAGCKTRRGEWNGWRRENFLQYFWPPDLNVRTFPTSNKLFRSRVTETPKTVLTRSKLKTDGKKVCVFSLHRVQTHYSLKTFHSLCCDEINNFCLVCSPFHALDAKFLVKPVDIMSS